MYQKVSSQPQFLLFNQNSFKFLKEKALKMIPKYGRIEAQSWPYAVRTVKAIIIFGPASHLK